MRGHYLVCITRPILLFRYINCCCYLPILPELPSEWLGKRVWASRHASLLRVASWVKYTKISFRRPTSFLRKNGMRVHWLRAYAHRSGGRLNKAHGRGIDPPAKGKGQRAKGKGQRAKGKGKREEGRGCDEYDEYDEYWCCGQAQISHHFSH